MKSGESPVIGDHAAPREAAPLARPPEERVRVLVVDDEPSQARSVAAALEARGFVCRPTQDVDEAVRAAIAGEVDVLLLDLEMPRVGGMEVLGRLRAGRADVEVVIMAAQADVDAATAAVKAGAYDYVTRPFASHDAAAQAVARAAERRQFVRRTDALERELAISLGYGHIVGASPRMREVFRLVEGVAASNSTVLIVGDRGTGKELIARALHERSTRAARPLVTVNCGAIPSDLVESELFGHARGAFVGATMDREGLFELAHRGTLFLDEVSDLPLVAQAKLLRALQDGEIRRVGSTVSRAIDVRVLAATHVDLRARIREGRFREDLYTRLSVVPIVLPALRDRREDIPLLATHFVRQFAARTGKSTTRISADAMRELESHDWPGNVRELENAIERAVAVARSEAVEMTDLPFGAHVDLTRSSALKDVSSAGAAAPAAYGELTYSEARRRAVWDFERRYVEAVLARTDGNITQAARTAGLDRSNFKRILRRIQAGANATEVPEDE